MADFTLLNGRNRHNIVNIKKQKKKKKENEVGVFVRVCVCVEEREDCHHHKSGRSSLALCQWQRTVLPITEHHVH